MTLDKIKELFNQAIQEKAVYNKLEGVTRNQVYNWIHNRGSAPTTGNMLDVLYQLNKISIHEPNRKP